MPRWLPGTPQRPSPMPRWLPRTPQRPSPTPRWPPGRRSALLQLRDVGDLGLEMRERRFGVDCGGDPVLPGAEGDGALAIAAQRGIGDDRPCRGRTEGRNGAALVAGRFLGAVLVRHGQAIDAEQSPQLGPGDLTVPRDQGEQDRKSTRLNSSHVAISYAVFCLKKKKKQGAMSVEQSGR